MIRIVMGLFATVIGLGGGIVAMFGVIVGVEQPGAYQLAILLFVVGCVLLSASILVFRRLFV